MTCSLPNQRCGDPSTTYKTRFLLKHKHIPYTLVPTHYPDICEVSLKPGLSEDKSIRHGLSLSLTTMAISVEVTWRLQSIWIDIPGSTAHGRGMREVAKVYRQECVPGGVASGRADGACYCWEGWKVFRETKPVGERVENHAKVVEAISPLIESIKEGGYIKGETLHYTKFGLGSIFVWVLLAEEEDFQESSQDKRLLGENCCIHVINASVAL